MWTKLVNLFGFWTKKQIGGQYTSGFEVWKDEHTAWMRDHGLNPLTFDPDETTTVNITINGEVTPETIERVMDEVMAARNYRRLKVAQDYLDGNDNWKEKL